MDPLHANDDDDMNFDKLGIHARLTRLIEKQTKRYEELISSGNHGDAQRLLQIIWQLKQLRLPGAEEEIQLEHSIPPDKYGPLLEPYLKNTLNDSQLSLLFDKKAPEAPQEASPLAPQEPFGPPISQMAPSMPELLSTYPPGLSSPAPSAVQSSQLAPKPASAPSILASIANTGLPPTPTPSRSPSILASLANTGPAPNMVRAQSGSEIPKPSPPIENPQSVNFLQEPIVPEPVPPSPAVIDKNVFDEIGSGEFDILDDEIKDDVEEMKSTGDKIAPVKFTPLPSMQKTSSAQEALGDFEDEASEYDNPEDNAPLRGLTTGHAPVVKKEDLEKYRNQVRETISWDEQEEIATKPKPPPKTYLREKVRIKSTKHVEEEEDDDKLDQFDDSLDFSEKKPAHKVLIIGAGVAACVVFCVVGFFAYSTMSSPSFETLEKMGQQTDKSPFEMTQLYEKATKANPKDVRGWSGLSYWQSRQGQNLPALESQANAIKLTPKDAKQWYALALLLKSCSNYRESLRAANEAVALEPNNNQYLSLQEQVQEYNP